MGGRKGYSIRKLIKNTKNIKEEQKLLDKAIEEKNPIKAVSASAHILAKSDMALEAITHSFLFMSGITPKDCEVLSKVDIKERRKEITQRWTEYRKKIDILFDPAINRDIIDSATRVIGGKI